MSSAPHLAAFNLDYSLKNIPTGNKNGYLIRLYDRANKFIENVRWRVFWYCRKDKKKESDEPERSSFCFPTTRSAEANPLLKPFEEGLFDLIGSVKFRDNTSQFQRRLRRDINSIKRSNKVFAFSDKTNNIYQLDADEYRKLVHDNITKGYRKAPEGTIEAINGEASSVIARAQVKGRIPKLSMSPAFVTIKDHKQGFPNKVSCRLINPTKSHIAKVSKCRLDNINEEIRAKTDLIQWKNSYEVINWFENIEDKKNALFLKFDIVEFYPSIKREQLAQAISFARGFTNISDDEERLIMHSCKTILTDEEGNVWQKKDNDDDELFDVAMGSFHGAEICDLLGLYLLNQLSALLRDGSYGLYRDDGLAVTHKLPPSGLERLSKRIRKVFGDAGFKITLEFGLHCTDFLDVFLDLRKDEYRPFRKDNSRTAYINNASNHPRYVRSALPAMMHKRVCSLSKNNTIFEQSRKVYDEALASSGHKKMDAYSEIASGVKKKRSRRKRVTYFHPPFCSSVKTKLGKRFLKLVEKCFPAGHPLHAVCNRSTLKISYSCLPNMKAIIQRHNDTVLETGSEDTASSKRTCNCRVKANCPLEGKCLTRNVIYKASVTSEGACMDYIGSTGNDFKERYNGHTSSFRKAAKRNSTALSKYIWELKDRGAKYDVKWSILLRSHTRKPSVSGLCSTCNLERMAIAAADRKKTLNQRSELTGKCKHHRRLYF